jgi:cyclomaltodextrinase
MFGYFCNRHKTKGLTMRKIFLKLVVFFILTACNFYEPVKMDTFKAHTVPEWTADAIWYQIFPERFANGDPANDPTLQDIAGAWPHDTESPWQVHPWTSDWYKRQPWEAANPRSFWEQVQRRRYGGDLQGIINRLDYLEELGINAIYLNPVFWSPSLHKYDGATYHHIDPNFGPDPAGDKAIIATEVPHDPATWQWTSADKLMLKLIKEVHARDMRVIFDGVFNHMGINSFAFEDVRKNGAKSPYADWFNVSKFPDPENGDDSFQYEGWFGHKELPELKEDDNGLVSGPRDYVFAATRRWMDPDGNGNVADGIDGWRLDVAFCVAHPFWKDWRKLVKSINPEAYLTAEVIDTPEALKPYLEGDEFDAVMNYGFKMTAFEYFVNETQKSRKTHFLQELQTLRTAFDPDMVFAMQNIYGSHDTPRFASVLANLDSLDYRRWGDYHRNTQVRFGLFDPLKPADRDYEKQKLMVTFVMTYVGAPMIYYGDEVGMWGGNDPCDRKPMVWPDMQYEKETYDAQGNKLLQPNHVGVRTDVLDHYKKMIQIRKANPALSRGSYSDLPTGNDDVFAFVRELEGNKIVIILNRAGQPQNFEIKMPIQGTELIAGKRVDLAEKGIIPPLGAMVIAMD